MVDNANSLRGNSDNSVFVMVIFEIPIGGDMTETKVEYLMRPKTETRKHCCPGCMQFFGFETPDGRLIVGELILSHFTGICAICGNPLSWYSTDHIMRSITEGARAR